MCVGKLRVLCQRIRSRQEGGKKDPFWNNGMRNAALGMVSWREVTFEIRVNYCAEAAADGWGMLASSENGVPAALGTH